MGEDHLQKEIYSGELRRGDMCSQIGFDSFQRMTKDTG